MENNNSAQVTQVIPHGADFEDMEIIYKYKGNEELHSITLDLSSFFNYFNCATRDIEPKSREILKRMHLLGQQIDNKYIPIAIECEPVNETTMGLCTRFFVPKDKIETCMKFFVALTEEDHSAKH